MVGLVTAPQNDASRFTVTVAKQYGDVDQAIYASALKGLLDIPEAVLLKSTNTAVLSQADKNSEHMSMVQDTMKVLLGVEGTRELPGLTDGSLQRKRLLELYYQVADGSDKGM